MQLQQLSRQVKTPRNVVNCAATAVKVNTDDRGWQGLGLLQRTYDEDFDVKSWCGSRQDFTFYAGGYRLVEGTADRPGSR